MIKVNQDVTINPAHISHMRWDRTHYMNGPGDSALVITMAGGQEIKVVHGNGVDAYRIEREIVAFDPGVGQ